MNFTKKIYIINIMCEPSSISIMCTNRCKGSLCLLLNTLIMYQSYLPIVLLCDKQTEIFLKNKNFHNKLNIHFFIELDKWSNFNRETFSKKDFGRLLENKMKIIEIALNLYNDTLLLDTDIILLSKLENIDRTKDCGLSPSYLNDISVNRTGKYNAGYFWTQNKDVCKYWKSIIDYNRKCPEQINMHKICDKFTFFEFGENYNIQCYRLTCAKETYSQKKMKSYFSIKNNKLFYKNLEVKCLHTHFGAPSLSTINNFFIEQLFLSKGYNKILDLIKK